MGRKTKIKICERCGRKCDIPCEALRKLYGIYRKIYSERKNELIAELRSELEIQDSEVADDLRELGEKIIDKIPELDFIRLFDIKIGYVRCYYPKKDKGKAVMGDCRKVNKTFLAYLPFDYVITIYEPNVVHLSENQLKVLMLHELMHVEVGTRGLIIREHEIEDFYSILNEFGIAWNGYDEEVKDILE